MTKPPTDDPSDELQDEDDEEVVVPLGELRTLASELSKRWSKARSQTSKHLVAQQLRLAVEGWGPTKMGDALALLAWRDEFAGNRGEFWRTAVWLLLGLDGEEFRRVSVIAKAIIDLEDAGVAADDTVQELGERGFDMRARTPTKARRRATAAKRKGSAKGSSRSSSKPTRSKSKARSTKKTKSGRK